MSFLPTTERRLQRQAPNGSAHQPRRVAQRSGVGSLCVRGLDSAHLGYTDILISPAF